MPDQKQTNVQQPQFEIQRIYIKDLSFEAPNTPHTFSEEWKPEVSLNLETKSARIQDHTHEVVITLTANVTSTKKSAFLIEVKQAGLFSIKGISGDQLHHMLGSFFSVFFVSFFLIFHVLSI